MKQLILISLILLTFIINPSSYGFPSIPRYNSSSLYPIGVSSLGYSFPISTNEVLGYVNIQTISTSSASLQFNAVIKATTSFGFVYDFWVQNMIIFSNGNYYFQDEIWNLTLPYANIDSSEISGSGSVETTTINGKSVSYYVYSTTSYSIATPLSYMLFICITTGIDTIYVKVGYGTPSSPTSFTYDYITIQVPGLSSANICVSSSNTGAGLPYDIELVWGGAGNGKSASFNFLQSQLAIFYEVVPGLFSPFSIIYDYGFDTQESVSDLYAYLGNNGLVCVTVGTPNPTQLTFYFTPLLPGWSEVTVFSNETYSVNGYNFTYNSNHNFVPPNFGLSYYISFTSDTQITVTLFSFKHNDYLISPKEICIIQPIYNSRQNTTQTTITIPTNSYYQLLVYYGVRPLKFYLTINIPMWGVVNNTYMLIRSGYYYYGTIIQLPSVNYTYINSLERIAFIPNVTSLMIISNVSIFVNKIYQYYVNINSIYPLKGSANNVNMEIKSGWYNNYTLISIPKQIYYVTKTQREVLLNPVNIRLSSPYNYTADWLTQFYVNISSKYPLYAIVNGVNESLVSAWYNATDKISIPQQIYYLSHDVRELLLNPITLVLKSPYNYTADWLTQYYVRINLPVNASINGKYNVFSSGWYNQSEKIIINVNPQYVSIDERVYIYNKTPIVLTVNSPLNVILNASVQFLVYFQIPVKGEINGSITNLATNWFNAFTIIKLNQTYFKYISSNERIMYIPSDTVLLINKSYNITFEKIIQYYLTFKSNFTLNGILNNNFNFTISNGWYNESDKITIPFQYRLINSLERYALLNPTTIIVNQSYTYNAIWGIQYYVTVISLKPVYAIINGTNTSFISNWYNEFDSIKIENQTYYVNSSARYAIYSIYPSLNFTLRSPINISVNYVLEYLVNINGKSFWVFRGTKITLYQPVPFYYSSKWEGTYVMNNNATVVVYSPIKEKITYSVNVLNILSVFMLLATFSVIISRVKK